MYYEGFPSKLKQARTNTGFTLREVSKELGIPHSTISNYETGRTQPDIETLGKLADFYGVSVDWLIGTRGITIDFKPKKTPQNLDSVNFKF